MSDRTPPRRAFALPLVIAVIVLASILITAILVRQMGQSLLTQRSIEKYQEHHAFKGIEEAVTAWVNATGRVEDALDAEGHAFDVEVGDGQVLKVYFEDAQGDLLGRFSGLADQDLDDAATCVDNLRRIAHSDARRFLRTEGPLAVSVAWASPEALRAVSQTLVSPVNATILVSELQKMQEDGDLTSEALNAALDAANVPQEDRVRAQRLLTTDPVLYRVWVEAWSRGSREPDVMYKALCLTSAGRGAARTATSVNRNSAFLSWERVALETDARTMGNARPGL
ncbi:MAG: hypothetical protein U0637_00205 [Phycisphaerales bacterium]